MKLALPVPFVQKKNTYPGFGEEAPLLQQGAGRRKDLPLVPVDNTTSDKRVTPLVWVCVTNQPRLKGGLLSRVVLSIGTKWSEHSWH
jgi:hypothetical protein